MTLLDARKIAIGDVIYIKGAGYESIPYIVRGIIQREVHEHVILEFVFTSDGVVQPDCQDRVRNHKQLASYKPR